MRGLDDYIMGIHDPNAPFNKIDWTEVFDAALNRCEWITEEMLDDDNTHELLGNLITEISEEFILPEKYYTSKEKYQLLIDNADAMAARLAEEYDYAVVYKDQHVAIVSSPIDEKYVKRGDAARVKNGVITVRDRTYGFNKKWEVL